MYNTQNKTKLIKAVTIAYWFRFALKASRVADNTTSVGKLFQILEEMNVYKSHARFICSCTQMGWLLVSSCHYQTDPNKEWVENCGLAMVESFKQKKEELDGQSLSFIARNRCL